MHTRMQMRDSSKAKKENKGEIKSKSQFIKHQEANLKEEMLLKEKKTLSPKTRIHAFAKGLE